MFTIKLEVRNNKGELLASSNVEIAEGENDIATIKRFVTLKSYNNAGLWEGMQEIKNQLRSMGWEIN